MFLVMNRIKLGEICKRSLSGHCSRRKGSSSVPWLKKRNAKEGKRCQTHVLFYHSIRSSEFLLVVVELWVGGEDVGPLSTTIDDGGSLAF